MLDERQTGLLREMLDSALLIRDYLAQDTRNDFLSDPQKQDAVLRRLGIIGEAARNLSPDIQGWFPQLPLRALRGMAKLITQDYDEIDVEFTWQTITNDLPRWIKLLSEHFNPPLQSE